MAHGGRRDRVKEFEDNHKSNKRYKSEHNSAYNGERYDSQRTRLKDAKHKKNGKERGYSNSRVNGIGHSGVGRAKRGK